MKRLNKKQFIELVKDRVSWDRKLACIKIMMDCRSPTTINLGLLECKRFFDRFKDYPKILWVFVRTGIDVSEPHLFAMTVSNSVSQWTEKIDQEDNVITMRARSRETIKYFNSTLNNGESRRKFKSVGFEYWNYDGECKFLKL